MKYIRTKDGISKMEEDIIEYVIKPNDIQFKQADTIEELCDEFVIVNNADLKPFRINVHEQWLTEVQKSKVPLIPLSIMTFDYAKERFEKLKEFVGTKENHNEYADYLYKENPNFVFNGTIKGAIWTDKGLIYVAKMNEKGELELL